MSLIKTGDKIADFTLVSSELKNILLSDFTGKKVVIHFFPLAFTGTCTEQLCTMRDTFGYYENMNAEILAISVDSPFVLAKYKEENQYQFNLLSDFNKEVSKKFGAFYEEFILGLKGVSKRAAFVLDENQQVLYAEVLENAKELPSFENIKNVLFKNQDDINRVKV